VIRILPLLLLLALASFMNGQTRLSEGLPGSAVQVVVYEDLQASYCARFRMMLDDKLLPWYDHEVEFVYYDFPLPKHDWARNAAAASRWFASQNPFVALEFRRQVLAHIDELTPASLPRYVRQFAAANKMDPDAAAKALSDPNLLAMVDMDVESGVALGVNVTPTVFVNTRTFFETFSLEEISRAIDYALPPKVPGPF
jgi:protein-disulfide isomerase